MPLVNLLKSVISGQTINSSEKYQLITTKTHSQIENIEKRFREEQNKIY